MGGGASRAEREEQARQAREREQDRQFQTQVITQANKPDPFVDRLRQGGQRYLDWFEGKGDFEGQPRDITKAPGFEPYLDLWGRARERRDSDRAGTGLFQLGARGANPNYVALLREQKDAERQQEAAGALGQAWSRHHADVTGSALPIASFDQSRNLSLAGLASSNAAGSRNSYSQFLTRPRRPSFWSQLAMQGLGVGAQVGLGALTGGLGNAALGGLGSAAGGLRFFRAGGRLSKWGEMALVGEDGPELLVNDPEGPRVVPLRRPPPAAVGFDPALAFAGRQQERAAGFRARLRPAPQITYTPPAVDTTRDSTGTFAPRFEPPAQVFDPGPHPAAEAARDYLRPGRPGGRRGGASDRLHAAGVG